MRVVICDDEEIYIDEIRQNTELFSKDTNIPFDVSAYTSPDEVLNDGKKYDIAVLDVEMNGTDGIALGKQLREINPHIILMYVTAHRKYLDDALNLNAVRFFEKPIDSKRFYRGLGDAVKRIDNTTINFYLKNGKAIERISANDIIFVEIENRKSKVVTKNTIYHSTNSIDFWKENLISPIFVSPHNSYIVNMNYITSYERDSIMLNDKYPVSVAKNKQSYFYKTFIKYMEIK